MQYILPLRENFFKVYGKFIGVYLRGFGDCAVCDVCIKIVKIHALPEIVEIMHAVYIKVKRDVTDAAFC